MNFSFSGPKTAKSIKREKLVFIPRYVQAVKSTVVINDLPKVIAIPADESIDLISICPLAQLNKSKQLQAALKMKLVIPSVKSGESLL
jgi:hypothetical protein